MFVKLRLLFGIASICALIDQGNSFCKNTSWGEKSDGPIIVGPVGISGSPSSVNVKIPFPMLLGCKVVGGLAFTCDSPDDTWLTYLGGNIVNVNRKKGGREGTLYGVYYCVPNVPTSTVKNRMDGFKTVNVPFRSSWNE